MPNTLRLASTVLVLALLLIGTLAAQRPAKADADMQAVLDQLTQLGGKPIETLSPQEARKQPTPADAVMALLKKQGKPTAPQPVDKVENRMVGGAAGNIPARVSWPSGNGPFPVLVYYHGGGWVIGSADVYDATPRALVNLAGCVVVSVNYRLAPEHKFPAAHDDAAAAYEWVLKNAASLNGDPRRVAVGGESAGGNLAVATAMAARDRKWQAPSAVMAIDPIASGETSSPSYRENAQAKPLNKPSYARRRRIMSNCRRSCGVLRCQKISCSSSVGGARVVDREVDDEREGRR